MSASCSCGHDHGPADPDRGNAAYRRVLWLVLAINAGMFLVEIGAGVAAGSASLQADALDFFGDAANYAISLFVVGMALRYRAMAAFAKGGSMALFGLWVIGTALWHAFARHAAQRFHHGRGRTFWRWPPTPLRSRCCGPIARAMPTCARPGFAPATT